MKGKAKMNIVFQIARFEKVWGNLRVAAFFRLDCLHKYRLFGFVKDPLHKQEQQKTQRPKHEGAQQAGNQ